MLPRSHSFAEHTSLIKLFWNFAKYTRLKEATWKCCKAGPTLKFVLLITHFLQIKCCIGFCRFCEINSRILQLKCNYTRFEIKMQVNASFELKFENFCCKFAITNFTPFSNVINHMLKLAQKNEKKLQQKECCSCITWHIWKKLKIKI